MSIVNFPSEVLIRLIMKLSLYVRMKFRRVLPARLKPLFFDRLLDYSGNSNKTITIEELYQLYRDSITEEETSECYDPKLLNRIGRENLN